jgi:hypothetical protein
MNLSKVTNLELILLSRMIMVICLQIPHRILSKWKNFFNQMLNINGVHKIRKMDIHTAEPLVPEPGLVEVEIVIGKLKRHKSLGPDQISAKLITAGGETSHSKVHKLIRSASCYCLSLIDLSEDEDLYNN